MVSSFISPLTGVNTSNMLEKLNFITGAVQEFVWSVSYPVLILNSWLFQPFQAKILWNGSKQRNKHKQSKLWSPFGWPLHRGFKCQKNAKKSLPTVISRIFQIKFRQIHLISVSVHCKCFNFKMCQNVAAIHITSQFHEFLNLIFGEFLSFETSGCRVGSTLLSKLLTPTENSVCSGSQPSSAQLEKDLLNEMSVWARERATCAGARWSYRAAGRACSSKTKLSCLAWCT